MANIGEGAKTVRSDKCCFWYHDRLPKYLREVLKEADHNWSDMQVYRMWKGTKKIPKRSPREIVELIERNEAANAYNWSPELKELMECPNGS